MKRILLSTVGCGALLFCTNTALAQDMPTSPTEETAAGSPRVSDNNRGLETIVVTAERRTSTVQTTPISISAVGGDDLRDKSISDVEGFSTNIPNLSFNRVGGDARVFIRGIGYNAINPGGEGRVAIYTDGIYQSRNQAALLGFYDIDRVEVLRGPQGTLYGRNSVAGAINVLTGQPSKDVNGYITGEVGSYLLLSTEGAVGGPLADGISGRIAFRTVDRNGYGEMIEDGRDVNDERSRSIRAKLDFEPTETLTIRLGADYSDVDDHSGGYRFAGRGNSAIPPLVEQLGLTTPDDPQDAAGIRPLRQLETWGINAQADLDLGPDTTITLLGGYRKFDFLQESSLDGSTAALAPIYIGEEADTYSAELRVAHKFGDFAEILIGGYYFDETNTATNQIPFKGLIYADAFGLGGILDPDTYYEFYGSFGRVKTEASAIFGQVRFELTDRLTLDIGARYSHETKDLEEQLQTNLVVPFVRDNPLITTFDPMNGSLGGTNNRTQTWTSFDPKATLSFQATDTLYMYATYSEGFKSGGYNIGGLQPPFDPETLTNYEVGIKADLFDRRARINLSVFNYDYKNLQESIIVGTVATTVNATSAQVRGLEAEITTRPVDNMRFDLNFAYLDGEFEEFFDLDQAFSSLGVQDLSGNQLPGAPKYQLGGELAYTIETGIGDFTPRANVTWYDKIFFNHFNTEEASQGERTMVNLYLSWESLDGGWNATAYVKNLTDDAYISATNVNLGLLGFGKTAAFGAPRTFGLSLTKSF